MRAVLQRVKYAKVSVDGSVVGQINKGIMALVGVNKGDNKAVYDKITDKITNLRIFEDENGKMNFSVRDISGGVLIVPNFTVYSDCKKGRRPGFVGGATPDEAESMFKDFVNVIKSSYHNIETGIFRADMQVELVNDGPVTIILDSDELMGGKV